MSNKRIFKDMYSKKINKERTFNTILKELRNENMKKNNTWKLIFIPACLVMVICGALILNNTSLLNSNKPIIDKNKNYEIIINKIDNSENGITKTDADIQRIDAEFKQLIEIPKFKFLKNIDIPLDLKDTSFNAIYVKENKNSKNYTILHNYDFWYENEEKNRRIILRFSDEFKPIRDYYFEENGKISIIKDLELKIYQYNNSYITTFRYNDINYDIETMNISEKEFIEFLTSIIK